MKGTIGKAPITTTQPIKTTKNKNKNKFRMKEESKKVYKKAKSGVTNTENQRMIFH